MELTPLKLFHISNIWFVTSKTNFGMGQRVDSTCDPGQQLYDLLRPGGRIKPTSDSGNFRSEQALNDIKKKILIAASPILTWDNQTRSGHIVNLYVTLKYGYHEIP